MPTSDDPPPRPPDKPDPGDCCGGGCLSCVYDAYETALERYEERLAAWHLSQLEQRPREAREP